MGLLDPGGSGVWFFGEFGGFRLGQTRAACLPEEGLALGQTEIAFYSQLGHEFLVGG